MSGSFSSILSKKYPCGQNRVFNSICIMKLITSEKLNNEMDPHADVTICYPAINDIAVSVHLTSERHPAQQVFQIQHRALYVRT
jgi:hypothetical protein